MDLQKVRKQLMELNRALDAEYILSLDPEHLIREMSITERVAYRRSIDLLLTGLQMRLSETSLYLAGLMQILEASEKTGEKES